MSWDSQHVPTRRGRHKAVRPDQVGRALRRALAVTVFPGLVWALGLLIFSGATSTNYKARLAATPDFYTIAAIGIAVVGLCWVGMICLTYVRHRSPGASPLYRLIGGAGVLLMCLAVSTPLAWSGKYVVDGRGVFSATGERSATTPKVSVKNPWGGRDRVNVLLLGGDGAVRRPGVRTDSVMLASIDVKTGKTILFSLPRNLQNVPFQEGSKLAAEYPNGFTDGKPNNAEYFLNAVYRNIPAKYPSDFLGKTDNLGADAVKLAVSGALGIPVDYYVLVNLAGFSKLVDAMGGITVNINEPIPIGGNTDAHIPPDSYLQPGPNQRLDGFKALWYTRGRYGSTDYKRMERQRCAINAIVAEASPMKLLQNFSQIARTIKHIYRTDIPTKLLPSFAELAVQMKGKEIRSVGFERTADFDPNEPDFDYVRETVQKALHPGQKVTPTTTSTSTKGPKKATNTKDDCAYRPVDTSSTTP